MDYEMLCTLNDDILKTSYHKLDKYTKSGTFDMEVFNVFSQALDNKKDLQKLKGYDSKMTKLIDKVNVDEVETEFETIMYKLMKKYDDDGLINVITCLADIMEDIRILQPQIYEVAIKKLKSMQ